MLPQKEGLKKDTRVDHLHPGILIFLSDIQP